MKLNRPEDISLEERVTKVVFYLVDSYEKRVEEHGELETPHMRLILFKDEGNGEPFLYSEVINIDGNVTKQVRTILEDDSLYLFNEVEYTEEELEELNRVLSLPKEEVLEYLDKTLEERIKN